MLKPYYWFKTPIGMSLSISLEAQRYCHGITDSYTSCAAYCFITSSYSLFMRHCLNGVIQTYLISYCYIPYFAANVFVGFLHIVYVAFFLKELRLQFYLVLLNDVKIFPFCYISLEQKELQLPAWKITLRVIYLFTRGIAQFEDVLKLFLERKIWCIQLTGISLYKMHIII